MRVAADHWLRKRFSELISPAQGGSQSDPEMHHAPKPCEVPGQNETLSRKTDLRLVRRWIRLFHMSAWSFHGCAWVFHEMQFREKTCMVFSNSRKTTAKDIFRRISKRFKASQKIFLKMWPVWPVRGGAMMLEMRAPNRCSFCARIRTQNEHRFGPHPGQPKRKIVSSPAFKG